MNLILDPWLPVRCRDGRTRRIRPAEMADPPEGGAAPVDIDAPRPDFRAALLEFLVGLVQTAFPPQNSREWAARLDTPPSPQALAAAFDPVAGYFNLLGKRPRFQQDLTLSPADKWIENDIDQLFMDLPGGGTFFRKPGRINTLCPACAAMALTTLQNFAPAGGRGNRTSLRGGGPLSTLLLGQTLWQTVAMNVLPLDAKTNPAPEPLPPQPAGAVFPWLAPTRTSEKGEEFHQGDGHFLHAYWGMPRRILLLEETLAAPAACDVCELQTRQVVRRYVSRPSGYNYGAWIHPLTPYRNMGDSQPPLSLKGRSDGAAYLHWLGLTLGEDGKKNNAAPALCVSQGLARLRKLRRSPLGLLACGYDMDNAKPLQWFEGVLPAPVVAEEHLGAYRDTVTRLVLAADGVRRNLAACLGEALHHESIKGASDKTRLGAVARDYWAETREPFFRAVTTLAQAPEDDELRWGVQAAFGKDISHTALELFDREALAAPAEPRRLKRLFAARGKLRNVNAKTLGKTLVIPVPTEAAHAPADQPTA